MQHAQSAVAKYGVTPVASAVGVNRSVMYRFCKTGRAIGRNRAALLKGLPRLEEAIQSATQNAPQNAPSLASPTWSVEDLQAARRLFGGMIALIEAYLATHGDAEAAAAHREFMADKGDK